MYYMKLTLFTEQDAVKEGLQNVYGRVSTFEPDPKQPALKHLFVRKRDIKEMQEELDYCEEYVVLWTNLTLKDGRKYKIKERPCEIKLNKISEQLIA